MAETAKRAVTCLVTHRIRIYGQISEHVQISISTDFGVPEDAVTKLFLNLGGGRLIRRVRQKIGVCGSKAGWELYTGQNSNKPTVFKMLFVFFTF